jgi:hypothetical protein
MKRSDPLFDLIVPPLNVLLDFNQKTVNVTPDVPLLIMRLHKHQYKCVTPNARSRWIRSELIRPHKK